MDKCKYCGEVDRIRIDPTKKLCICGNDKFWEKECS